MAEELNISDLERRMKGALEQLHKEFGGLRTGRASTNLLENVVVDAYGSKMPINQLANVNAPEPRLLTVQVWDQSQVDMVEKAIRNAGLGLNPMRDGSLIRVPLPELNEERRNELTKVAGKYAEQARISIRNIRRDGMDTVKASEKDGDISEDDAKRLSDDVQKLTDKYVGIVDSDLERKEGEIMQV
tara:strand:- start:18 stop:578 length:561 start_codon:yes stop_codon:yes gene_type:complete